jgi:Lysyl oxidase
MRMGRRVYRTFGRRGHTRFVVTLFTSRARVLIRSPIVSERSTLLVRATRLGLPLLVAISACAPNNLSVNGIRDAAVFDASSKDTGIGAPDVPLRDATVTSDAGRADALGDDIYVDVPVVIDPDQPLVDAGADAPRPLDAPRVDGGALPNLIPVISNPQIQERTFLGTSCEVMEGCTVAGNRRLLRFDLTTPNIGAADLYLGPPTMAGRPPMMFEYGTCHMHWHLRGYADYRLLDMAGREVGRGHKQSFCLLDSGRYMSMGTDIPAAMRYNCSDQGIHAGWMDVYGRGLDCQYVDITGIPPGRYRIRALINAERVVTESNYDDNESFYTIDIPAPPDSDGGAGDAGVSLDPTLACAAATEGTGRNCGWQVEGAPRTCTPGARVEVGCNQGCMPPLGLCAGDPMIRICPGGTPCQDLTAITVNDDACPGDGGPTRLCSLASFTCPSIGRYTILTGAYRAGMAYECHLETR